MKNKQNRKRFSRIYIEITNICNLSCSFCIGNQRTPRILSIEAFQAIITQVQPLTDHIYLHVLGEPLLHPQLERFLAIAESANLCVNLTTNGTLLRKNSTILLQSKALRKVSVSLHSLEPHSTVHPFDYIQQVADFAQKASLQGIFCEMRLWNLSDSLILQPNTTQTTENILLFDQLCRALDISTDHQLALQQTINQQGSAKLLPYVFLGKAARFDWPSLHANPTNQPVFCHGLRSQIGILCDGTVVPCCLDSCGDIALGNVFQTPLRDIIQCDRAQDLLHGFDARTPVEALCQRCGFATKF